MHSYKHYTGATAKRIHLLCGRALRRTAWRLANHIAQTVRCTLLIICLVTSPGSWCCGRELRQSAGLCSPTCIAAQSLHVLFRNATRHIDISAGSRPPSMHGCLPATTNRVHGMPYTKSGVTNAPALLGGQAGSLAAACCSRILGRTYRLAAYTAQPCQCLRLG